MNNSYRVGLPNDKPGEWIQVDLENLYTVNQIRLVFASGAIARRFMGV